MTGMSLLFGASFVGTKIALEDFSPSQLICLRFALATVLFYAVSSVMGLPRIDRAGHLSIFLMSLFEPGAYFFLEAAGIQRTLASTAAILISTIPLFVLVLEALWLRVPVVPVEVVLILVSFGGIFLLVVAGAGPSGSIGGRMDGNLLILGAALCASFYTIIARRLLNTYSPLGVTRLQTLYASLLYLPFAVWDTFTRHAAAPGFRGWAALLYLSLGCSFLAYWLLNYSLAHVKASIVSAFTNVIPVVGTVLAVALLGERLYPLQAVGAVVVLGATSMLALRHVRGDANPTKAHEL
jgi:drug/metabolite transporter (DMT)-like permease